MTFFPGLLEINPQAKPISSTHPATPPLIKHFVALDGLRGVAVLAVVGFHFSSILGGTPLEKVVHAFFAPGYLGVTLFFVLSGFLISRILVRTRDNPDFFSTFYKRRSLRIFPLYYAYVAFIILVYYPLKPRGEGETSIFDWHYLAYLFYVSNFKWSLAIDPGLLHLWSLAIEEQFYLMWPFVVFLTPRRWLLSVCVLGWLGSLGYRIGLSWHGHAPFSLYMHTLSRMDALLIGAAVGVVELGARARERLIRMIRPVLVVCVLGTIATAARFGFKEESVPVMLIVWPVLTLFFAILVFWSATSGANNRLLNQRWLRALGKYSYGIYVLHWFPMMVLPKRMPADTATQRVVAILVCVAVTGALAMLSWYTIERPFLRLKERMAYNT